MIETGEYCSNAKMTSFQNAARHSLEIMAKFLYKSMSDSHLFKRLLHCWVHRDFDASEGVQDMGKVACQLHVPQEADLVVQLDGGDSLGEVGHNPLEELVVDCEADEQLELVILSETVACRFYPRDQPEREEE